MLCVVSTMDINELKSNNNNNKKNKITVFFFFYIMKQLKVKQYTILYIHNIRSN